MACLSSGGVAARAAAPLQNAVDPPSVEAVPFGGPGTGQRLPGGLCIDTYARAPIIKPGRENDIVALFAPHKTEAPLAGHDGWAFLGISVSKHTIAAKLAGPEGAQASVTLEWVGCAVPGQPASKSFAIVTTGAAGPAKTLVDAVTTNDPGGFWQAWSLPPGYRRVPRGGPAAAGSGDGDGGDGGMTARRIDFRESNAAILLFLGLCLLSWLLVLPLLVKELRLTGQGARATLLWLFALTIGGLVLRYLADPTFIREAYPFPNVAWQVEPIDSVLYGGLDAYPRGPETMMHFAGPWLSADPYRAWFLGRLHLGALTIPWAFVIGTLVFSKRAAGLVFAAMLALLPHHIRLSASESTHIDMMFFGMAAAALAILAARTGKLSAFLAAACTACATVCMRPEGAVVGAGLAALALGAGPGLRDKWKNPLFVAVLAVLAYMLWPTLYTTLIDDSAKNFDPTGDDGEGLGLGAVVRTAIALVAPDGRNAAFDPQISPLWVYPLMLYGAYALWRDGKRGVAIGFGLLYGLFLFVYSGLPPSVTVWKMGRYHTATLLGAAPLLGAGMWHALGALARRANASAEDGRWARLAPVAARPVVTATVVAVLGAAIWWPAVAALPLDWQRDAAYVIALGRKYEDILGDPATRIILPDNRRRFLDQAPRTPIVPLTRQKQSIENAVTIAHALEFYRANPGSAPEAYFYEGFFCHNARATGEPFNPQCQAMRDTFELHAVDLLKVPEGSYLNAYEAMRPEGEMAYRLYRVGKRRLSPQHALAKLPKPRERNAGNDDDPNNAPYGRATSQYMEPVQPPLGTRDAAER